jgi:hypothetical protein
LGWKKKAKLRFWSCSMTPLRTLKGRNTTDKLR